MDQISPQPDTSALLGDIRRLIEEARERVAVAVNRELTLMHWHIGNLIRNVGIGLPCHHHYRPLTFSEYGGRAKTPLFPTKADIKQVHEKKRPVLAWTHFVMDDDAYCPKSWGIVHSEVRYIATLLQSLQNVGIDSVIDLL